MYVHACVRVRVCVCVCVCVPATIIADPREIDRRLPAPGQSVCMEVWRYTEQQNKGDRGKVGRDRHRDRHRERYRQRHRYRDTEIDGQQTESDRRQTQYKYS